MVICMQVVKIDCLIEKKICQIYMREGVLSEVEDRLVVVGGFKSMKQKYLVFIVIMNKL